MALTHIPIENIDQSHLQALVDTGAAESQYLDYKRETFGSNDDARAEFLADVSSFANTAGGDLIIGMTAAAGVPTSFEPFRGDSDAERLRFESMARSGLEPRIARLQIRAVPLSGGGCALVVRVPRSYNPPHRVIFKNKNRFWARSSVGKYEPNVDQLRDLFTLAPQVAKRIQDFRLDRIAKIAADEAPVRLMGNGVLVLHVAPFSAFTVHKPLRLLDVEQQRNYFPPIGTDHPSNWWINFDGLLTLSNRDERAPQQRAYIQVFRLGVIEAVASSFARGERRDLIILLAVEHAVIKYSQLYMLALHEFGVDPPFAVLASLLGVSGYTAHANFEGPQWGETGAVLDRDQLHCTEVVVEAIPNDYQQCAIMVRPILDQFANAAGLPSSPFFGADGTYHSQARR